MIREQRNSEFRNTRFVSIRPKSYSQKRPPLTNFWRDTIEIEKVLSNLEDDKILRFDEIKNNSIDKKLTHQGFKLVKIEFLKVNNRIVSKKILQRDRQYGDEYIEQNLMRIIKSRDTKINLDA